MCARSCTVNGVTSSHCACHALRALVLVTRPIFTRAPCTCVRPAQVEWAHQIIAGEEKMYMTGAAVAGAIAAFCLLVWVGPPALAINLSAASEELTLRIAAMARAKLKNLPPHELQPVTEPGPMGTVLALVGGVLGERMVV
jgi:hypothetical protein